MSEARDDKSYRITFDSRPDYLYALVEGNAGTFEISIGYWREIAAECEARQVSKLLIEEDIADMVSVADMYNIASEIPPMYRGVTIAFVDRRAEQSELNAFGELVALNRGVVGKLFTNVAAAEKWLLSQ